MELWIGALTLGLLYSFLAMGVFLTFRIFDFPDITVDGSVTTGAAVSAILLVAGWHPLAVLPLAVVAGMVAGAATGFIHTRFQVNGLLAGILVMTGLYSVNLRTMGRANIPLLREETFFSWLEGFNPGLPEHIWVLVFLLLLLAVFWGVVTWFLRTDMGVTMRATGDNATMVAASGVDVDRTKILGIALANGLVALSGALVAQFQGFVDIGMGIGVVVFGLASVIIGESILRSRWIPLVVLSVILGSVVFRFMVALALSVGLNPIDLKLITALFVLATLVLSKQVASGKVRRPGLVLTAGAAAIMVLVGGWKLLSRDVGRFEDEESYAENLQPGRFSIGVIQLVDHPILNHTRDAFIEEMGELGYVDGQNLRLLLGNAHGDIASLPTILDGFLQEDVDLVLSISTPATQAMINRIKDRPALFATVSNPFVIDAGETDEDHLPNVTGVYGSVPMDQFLAMSTAIMPGMRHIGVMWNEGQANAVYNVEQMRGFLASDYPHIEFEGGIVSTSSEVYDHALALAGKGIDAFVLPPDNTVFSALEAVEKAADQHGIPILLAEVARIEGGVVGAVGFDYHASGIQAAHLAHRVLGKGEDPGRIPFQRYTSVHWGVNLDKAAEMGLTIPDVVMDRAELVVRGGVLEDHRRPTRIHLVQPGDDPNREELVRGLEEGLADAGFFHGKNIELVQRDAGLDAASPGSIPREVEVDGRDLTVPLSASFLAAPPPVEAMLALIGELLPDRTRLGLIWSTEDSDSETVAGKLRSAAEEAGLQLLEEILAPSSNGGDAARDLVSRGAEILLAAGGRTVRAAYPELSEAAASAAVPLLSLDPSTRDEGTLAVLGTDYYQAGYEGGGNLARVLKGEDASDLPTLRTNATRRFVNVDRARRLGVEVPSSVIESADSIAGQEGTHGG